MSFKSIDHSTGNTIHIDKIEVDTGKIVSAVEECTGEVAKLHIKKIPPPVINNEIVTPPATVVNKIPENKPEIRVNVNLDGFSKSLRLCGVGLCSTLVLLFMFDWVFKYWGTISTWFALNH